MSKYYMAHNAGNREIAGERFEVVEIFAGTAIGVFEATTEAQQIALDAAVKIPTNAVEEISKGEYDNAVKKKAPSLSSYRHSNVAPLQTSLRPVAGVVVEERPAEDLTEITRLESVAAALDNTGEVTPPPKPEAPEAATKKKK